MRLIALALSVILAAGCAAQPMTREQSLSLREETIAATVRVYPDKSPADLIAAAEELLRLADGDDMRFAHDETGFNANRWWMVYVVLAFVSGTDFWRFTAVPTEDGGGTKATVNVSTQMQNTTPTPTTGGAWSAGTGPAMSAPYGGTAVYEIFWARMDYLLGLRPDWMSCVESNQRLKSGAVRGANDPLCNSFNLRDESPEGVAAHAKPAPVSGRP